MANFLKICITGLIIGTLADYIFTHTPITNYSYIMYDFGVIMGVIAASTLNFIIEKRG